MRQVDKHGLYMRHHSSLIRSWRFGEDTRVEDPVVEASGLHRSVLHLICRNRQKLLSAAWNYWTRNTGVSHDYTADIRSILSRPICDWELRTELEIEVMYKWVLQNCNKDPTGLAFFLRSLKRRDAIVRVLQEMRLETFDAGDVVTFQGSLPRKEDGYFCVLSGSCDLVTFPSFSVRLMQLHEAFRAHRWDAAREAVLSGTTVCSLGPHAGFGVLSTLTKASYAASVCAGSGSYALNEGSSSLMDGPGGSSSAPVGGGGVEPTEILVVPAAALVLLLFPISFPSR
jgi:hypothetical protein